MSALNNLSKEGREGFLLTVLCCAIAGIALVLRFVAKKLQKIGYHADDWFMLVALATYWGAAGLSIWGLIEGDGLPVREELYTELHANPKLLTKTNNYLAAIFWGVLVVWFSGYFLKVSICLFYKRLLSDVVYRKTSLLLIGLSTGWIISTEVSNVVTCIPVHQRWHIEQPNTCKLNFNTMYLGTGCVETVIDAALLVVPIRVVMRTRMSLKTRLTVVGIFLLGGFAVITDIVRMRFIYRRGKTEDVNFKAAQFWLNIHMAVSILSGSLPTMKPLWTRTGAAIRKIRDQFAIGVRSVTEQLFKHRTASRIEKISSGNTSDERAMTGAPKCGLWWEIRGGKSSTRRWILPSFGTMSHTIDLDQGRVHEQQGQVRSQKSSSTDEAELV